MAEAKKDVAEESDIKTQKVEIIKFHPLVAHEVGETPELGKSFAKDWIEKGYAKAVK